jgi:hypothetical protein
MAIPAPRSASTQLAEIPPDNQGPCDDSAGGTVAVSLVPPM